MTDSDTPLQHSRDAPAIRCRCPRETGELSVVTQRNQHTSTQLVSIQYIVCQFELPYNLRMANLVSTADRPKSLTDHVTDEIRRWVITGEIGFGEKLSEGKIAQVLDVSRTPVREAINRLETERLLIVEPQRGSFVFTIGKSDLKKLCDARICMEAYALEAGIAEDSEGLYRALSTCVDAMTVAREASDDSHYLDLDAEFHLLLVSSANNPFIADAYQTMAPRMAALRYRLGQHPDHMTKSYQEHQALCAAVKDRDLQLALKILASHIDRKEGNYWSKLASEVS